MDKDQIKLAEDFKRTAERFCTLVDTSSRIDRNELLSQFYLILPELIRAAASLPAVRVDDDAEEEENNLPAHPSVRMTIAEWQQLYESLKAILAPNDNYWMVWESWKVGEALKGSLADDIVDIYRDLKAGIGEKEMRNKVWEWRLAFYSHWGKHATGALRAIHDLIADVRVED